MELTPNMNLEELQALAAKAKEENQVKVNELAQTARLRNEIARLTNPAAQQASARMALVNETTDKLTSYVQTCRDVVDTMPIYNAQTRKQRQFAGRKTYNVGNHIGLVHELLTGIQYATEDHRNMMLEATGLNMDLVESTLEAFGQQAYYTANVGVIVPEVPYDIETLSTNLQVIANILNLDIDTSKVTESNFKAQFKSAYQRAERMMADAENTASLQTQLIVD